MDVTFTPLRKRYGNARQQQGRGVVTMEGDRFCVRCGEYLGNYLTGNYYSLIRRKYCEGCKPVVECDQTAERMRTLRRRNREKRSLEQERLRLLETENQLLRERVEKLRHEAEFLDKSR